MDEYTDTAVIVPEKEADTEQRTRRQPPYHVVLWDDDEHTPSYVVTMLKQLFGHQDAKGVQIADEIHTTGRAIVLTTTMEHAELKRDQIHAFGSDKEVAECVGAMSASIEPAHD